jgi:very-short-patch-repair endonuclease
MAATDEAYKAARRLRKQMSLPEVLLWRLLRKASPPVRRQHPIGGYVVDFTVLPRNS